MICNELFESAIREAREDYLSQLFELVLREMVNNSSNDKSPLSKARGIARKVLGLNITKNEIIDFTKENYEKELGGEIQTPLGNVKMSNSNWGGGTKNAFQKMNDKIGRKEDLFKTNIDKSEYYHKS